MLKIIFVGGTIRGYLLFKNLIERNDISIVYGIFMAGYEDERCFSVKLAELAENNHIDHIISDVIDEKIIAISKSKEADVIIGGGIWRTKVPDNFLNLTRYGYLALHGSGLPKYRGWAGINWYIINGENEYIMRMLQLDNGVDSGPLVANKQGKLFEYKIDLENQKHINELLEEVYKIHIYGYNEMLDHLLTESVRFIPQDEASASYTCHRGPEDGEINWFDSTRNVFNFIRAQAKPYPGAFTHFNGKKVIIWRCEPRYEYSNYVGRICGKVVHRDQENHSVIVLTKDGAIEITEAEEVSSNTNDPYIIFNSVRKRCKSKVEAYIESLDI